MERDDALGRLAPLVGQDLRRLAPKYDITVFNDRGKLNKGWAGHVVERFLGLPLNSSRGPNLGAWELKTISMVERASGDVVPKETMAITMIDAIEVQSKDFFDSHLFTKLRRLVLVSRLRVDRRESSSKVLAVRAVDLEQDLELLELVRKDYQVIQSAIRAGGVDALKSGMGEYVQPRTKGAGHGSTSRAFYAKKTFLSRVLEKPAELSVVRNGLGDCIQHAGVVNAANREALDEVMAYLPANQSGVGRHRCVYCAYAMGYRDAVDGVARRGEPQLIR